MLRTSQAAEQKENNPVSDFSFYNEKVKEKTVKHPCYNGCNHENARMHLPVAPRCNIQCNYCVRKFDCANESRPGVATRIISPGEALEKYIQVKKTMANLSVVGIAGPGDALCDFENTSRTLRLIREYDPHITFCLSTNGLMLPDHADELDALGVSHVTVTINAVDPEISAGIYKYVRYEGVEYSGDKAGALLLQNQLRGLNRLIEKGIVCKVNIVVLKGINDFHIPEIVKTVKELGCYIVNIMPLIPVQGSEFEHLPATTAQEIMKLRRECGRMIRQMHHCRQCRADAVGCL